MKKYVEKNNVNDESVIIRNITTKNNQEVFLGQKLLEYETSKTIIEVHAEKDGLIKLYKDGSTISVKELIGRFTSRMMSQIGKDKAKGNITDDQMKSLESFLQNQKLA